MQIEDNLTQISLILRNNGIVLYPVDGIWGLTCNPFKQEAVSKILSWGKGKIQIHEILVSDLLMLKAHVSSLHPRIETMLTYHERPLKLILEGSDAIPENLTQNGSKVCFRIVKDKRSRKLINTHGCPLYNYSFLDHQGVLPLGIDEIRRKPLPNVDYVSLLENEEFPQKNPILLASIDDEGMLTVH